MTHPKGQVTTKDSKVQSKGFEPELEKHKYPSILDTEELFQIEEHCGKILQYL